MGALHEGHLALVRRSVEENHRTCVSIFVNPLQFNDASDFDRYPRNYHRDSSLLDHLQTDMIFTAELLQFFPEAKDPSDIIMRDPGPRGLGLEGSHRPGHFAGVCTIVERLFEVVQPDIAYFGEKDFQQSLVIEDLAMEVGYPQIAVCRTVREPSGLAMSSRNTLLSKTQRDQAAFISLALYAARDAWRDGERDAAILAQTMQAVLSQSELEIEYAETRDPEAWTAEQPNGHLERAQALIAARIATVRLIDNLSLDSTDQLP